MSNDNTSKIKQLLYSQPSGVVLLSSWLSNHGYSLDLQKRYKKSGWFESLGIGALIRTDDKVKYEGAIYALQNQLKSTIHPGGKTALSLLGKSHYLELGNNSAILFGEPKEQLPAWFKKHDWGIKISYHKTVFLPSKMALTEVELTNFSIKVSSPARAILECLYLAPKEQSLMECYELMEGLNNLPPKIVQELLEKCTSVKVKRLFMYLAEKAGHSWFEFLVREKINLGKGKRSIVKNGIYIDKYQITVPRELGEHGKSSL